MTDSIVSARPVLAPDFANLGEAVREMVATGADTLVAGSAVLKGGGRAYAANIAALRATAQTAAGQLAA